MSVRQRIIIRMGNAADIPTLVFGEVSMDVDTFTMRLGDDTPNPPKIMTTKSKGIYDYSSVDKIILPNIEFAEGAGIGGLDFESLAASNGIVVSTGGGSFRQTSITSNDGSVIISNASGQTGTIDIRVSAASITNALGSISQELLILGERIDDIEVNNDDYQDTLLKLIQLTGRPSKFTEMGTFLHDIIPDNATIKTALQALETALFGLNANNFLLEIVGRDATHIGLQLTDDNIVTFESATPDLAGLMAATDKAKLEHITVITDITLENIQVTSVESDTTSVTLINSNGTEIPLPLANSAQAGVILPADWDKIGLLTVTSSINLDQLEDRVTVLENYTISPTYYKDAGTVYWTSSDTDTSHTLILPNITTKAFSITFERKVDGFDYTFYDAITINGLEVAEAENVTKAYSKSIVFFKARTGSWYYLNDSGIAFLFEADPTANPNAVIECGTTNAVQIRGLELL